MRHYPPRREGPHTGWSPGRDRAKQAKFRAALIARSGGYCERCGASPGSGPMQAHHTQPGYTPDCGLLLCRPCHRLEDPHAR